MTWVLGVGYVPRSPVGAHFHLPSPLIEAGSFYQFSCALMVNIIDIVSAIVFIRRPDMISVTTVVKVKVRGFIIISGFGF